MIQEALQEIKRGTAEVIDNERIEKLVRAYFEEGKTYTVKAGFDPTAPDLHLGHTVLLQKLATFQRYGGRIQFLIGDFTAKIGDPSGKSETRKQLSDAQIAQNAQSYKTQVFKILDPEKTEVVFNSKWIAPLGADGLLALTTTFNVARMLERDDFEKRYNSQTPIAISEFIYPLLQGYDSVALKSDIEIGGTDQKFNLLMGRQLQRTYGVGKEQSVLMMPILEGLDGVQKMSKSLNNYIGVTDEANDMYGKVLSISDELMWRYYELLSAKRIDEIAKLKEQVNAQTLHPKAAKEMLALEIVTRFHSEDKAQRAKEAFEQVHANNALPDDMPEFKFSQGIDVCTMLVQTNLCPSTSQARRDIKAGAFKVDQTKQQDVTMVLTQGTYIIQIGKRKFAKVEIK